MSEEEEGFLARIEDRVADCSAQRVAQQDYLAEDSIELQSQIITPAYKKWFKYLDRDMVLSILTEADRELIIIISELINCIEIIQEEGKMNDDPILEKLKQYYLNDMLTIIETSRAKDGKTLDYMRINRMQQDVHISNKKKSENEGIKLPGFK